MTFFLDPAARINRRGVFRAVGGAGLLGLGAATLAACTLDVSDVDLTAFDEAVTASCPRIMGIEDSSGGVNGLGHAIRLYLRLDTADPLSADDLDDIIEAIWVNAPWEPNAIRMVAGASDAAETPVDLEPDREDLEPLSFGPFGNLGVTVLGAEQRYGEWKKPD